MNRHIEVCGVLKHRVPMSSCNHGTSLRAHWCSPVRKCPPRNPGQTPDKCFIIENRVVDGTVYPATHQCMLSSSVTQGVSSQVMNGNPWAGKTRLRILVDRSCFTCALSISPSFGNWICILLGETPLSHSQPLKVSWAGSRCEQVTHAWPIWASHSLATFISPKSIQWSAILKL